jgi:hypothetical protein
VVKEWVKYMKACYLIVIELNMALQKTRSIYTLFQNYCCVAHLIFRLA